MPRLVAVLTPMQPEGEPDMDKMAQRAQSLIKFKHFYDQMEFNPE